MKNNNGSRPPYMIRPTTIVSLGASCSSGGVSASFDTSLKYLFRKVKNGICWQINATESVSKDEITEIESTLLSINNNPN
jgi:hypothetical protein